MRKTLAEIAKIIDGDVVGDETVVITGLSGIKEAKEGDLTFIANPQYFPLVRQTQASAILIPPEMKAPDKPSIRTSDPSLAFARMMSHLAGNQERPSPGVHPSAVVDPGADLGKDVSVGPCAVIEKGAKVGDNTIIYSHVFVGRDAVIGPDCVIHPNVVVRERVSIGKRVVIHCGAVIGSDGFGFANVEGVHHKIPQIGTVEIGDDVEVGANVAVDRARFDRTVIGSGTKIDNLVQIAHNVRIGENCIIVAQAGISGSTTVEKNAVLAGQVGVVGHITIGEGAVIASQSGVSKSVPPGARMWGYPAKPLSLAKRINACVQRLPMYVRMIRDLEQRIQKLEGKKQ